MKSLPLSAAMAARKWARGISTKPKPLDAPLNSSRITCTSLDLTELFERIGEFRFSDLRRQIA
jgi:hypothetical protein